MAKQYGMVIDTTRCMGCQTCAVACKVSNDVPGELYWAHVEGLDGDLYRPTGTFPKVKMNFRPTLCNHCADAPCVKVCPTGASHIAEDGTVQIDKSKCIGCQFCAMSCPYGVRYLNEEERVVEKCTLCEQQIAQGDLPQCVKNCVGMAKWFGDADGDIRAFKGVRGETIGSFCEEFSDSDVHHLPDVGNRPSFLYILRDHTWKGEE